MSQQSMRYFMDLMEGRSFGEWTVEQTPLFKQTLNDTRAVFRNIDEKLERFIELKTPNPLDPSRRYGKHDCAFSSVLTGFWHCHLRDDAVLIYKLRDRKIVLIAVVPHAEIEGKKARQLAKKISSYL